jgi:hypothetical protein
MYRRAKDSNSKQKNFGYQMVVLDKLGVGVGGSKKYFFSKQNLKQNFG